MFRRKRSKEKAQARERSLRERMEQGGAHDPSPNGHGAIERDEKQDEYEFTDEPDEHLDEEPGEIREGDRAFNAAVTGEARPATEDEVAEKVNTIWRQRLEDDPEGALLDLRARVNELGYRLAYAGHTHGEPVTKRTYYIMDENKRRMDVFHDGVGDLTLLEVCSWSELAFKRWKDS